MSLSDDEGLDVSEEDGAAGHESATGRRRRRRKGVRHDQERRLCRPLLHDLRRSVYIWPSVILNYEVALFQILVLFSLVFDS